MDDLGVPDLPSNGSRDRIRGGKFRATYLPQKAKPQEKGLSFPIEIAVAGVTQGPRWCEICSRVMGEKESVCSLCGDATLVKSYRQHSIELAQKLGLGVATLVPEPENAYDPEAIAVMIKFPGNKNIHIGYVPAKVREGASPVTNKDLLPLINSGKRLWINFVVVGGPQQNKSDMSFGLRLNINDKPNRT